MGGTVSSSTQSDMAKLGNREKYRDFVEIYRKMLTIVEKISRFVFETKMKIVSKKPRATALVEQLQVGLLQLRERPGTGR